MTRKLTAKQLEMYEIVDRQDPHQLLMNRLLAGSAKFTLTSVNSGTRFTYHIRSGSLDRDKSWSVNNQNRRFFFVKVLCGPDNQRDYRLVAIIRRTDEETTAIDVSKWATASDATPKSFEAIQWWLHKIFIVGVLPDEVALDWANSCGRCGRELTVPESIRSGFGPECIAHA